MASAITHFVVGAAIALPAIESRALRPIMPRWALPVTAGLWAAAPDLDTPVTFALGIPRTSIFSHRGVFHSPFFLIAAAIFLAWLVAGKYGEHRANWLALMWAVAAVSHPLLDMLTDGGSGVMILYPFTTRRYFFPWRPIHVSPLTISAFFRRAGPVLWSELPFNIAAVVVGLAGLFVRKRSAAERFTEAS